MEQRYLYIIDSTTGFLNIIELTDEEIKESENERYMDFEDFMLTIEEKYGFRVKNSSWMLSNDLKIDAYRNGERIDIADL